MTKLHIYKGHCMSLLFKMWTKLTWCINEVNFMFFPVKGDSCRSNSNSSFPFLCHVICDSISGINSTCNTNNTVDKREYSGKYFFLFLQEIVCCVYPSYKFLHEYICCAYSLEAPQQGASNEYQQHMFSSGYKKIWTLFWLKKGPSLEI